MTKFQILSLSAIALLSSAFSLENLDSETCSIKVESSCNGPSPSMGKALQSQDQSLRNRLEAFLKKPEAARFMFLKNLPDRSLLVIISTLPSPAQALLRKELGLEHLSHKHPKKETK